MWSVMVCNAQCSLYTEHKALLRCKLACCKKCAAVELSWGGGGWHLHPAFLPLSSVSSSALALFLCYILVDPVVLELASFLLSSFINQVSVAYRFKIPPPCQPRPTMSSLFLIIRPPLWSVRPSNGCFALQFTRPTFTEGVPRQPSGICQTLPPFWAN